MSYSLKYLYATFTVSFSITACSATDILETIRKSFADRQSSIKSAEFQILTKRTIHKGSLSYNLELLNPSEKGKIQPSPPKDITCDGTCELIFKNGKISFVAKYGQWDMIQQAITIRSEVDVYDDDLSISYTKDSTENAIIKKTKKSTKSLYFPISPIFMNYRSNHPQFINEIDTYECSNKTVLINNRHCYELYNISLSYRMKNFVYVDKNRDYVIVRRLLLENDLPVWQIDIDYMQDPNNGWIPKFWTYQIRVGKEGFLHESGNSNVESYKLNSDYNDSVFKFELPSGTLVEEIGNGKRKKYTVGVGDSIKIYTKLYYSAIVAIFVFVASLFYLRKKYFGLRVVDKVQSKTIPPQENVP